MSPDVSKHRLQGSVVLIFLRRVIAVQSLGWFFCSIDDGPTNIKFFFCFPEFLILAFFSERFSLQLICFSPIILKLERHFLTFGCAGSSLLHRLSQARCKHNDVFCCKVRAPECAGTEAVAYGLQGSLNGCGPWACSAMASCGIFQARINRCPHIDRRILIRRITRKPCLFLKFIFISIFSGMAFLILVFKSH